MATFENLPPNDQLTVLLRDMGAFDHLLPHPGGLVLCAPPPDIDLDDNAGIPTGT